MNQTTLETLVKAGMEPKGAELYLILVEHGESTVPAILTHTGLSRATVYEILPVLEADKFVEYRKEGRVVYYRAVHPNKLFELLDHQKRQLALLEEEVQQTVRQVMSSYELANNKPGVRFFEGEAGIKEALFDSLNATETICAFVNNKTVAAYAKQLDRDYVEKRIQKKIKKKIIMIDNQEARYRAAQLHNEFTEIKFIKEAEYPFEGASEIYDNTVSHIMIYQGTMTAMLIKHPQIATLQKMLFRFLWEKLS